MPINKFSLKCLALIFLHLQFFFNYAQSATISDQKTVNINASVPAEGGVVSGGGGGAAIITDSIPPEIISDKIDSITPNLARISWKTNELSIPQINYGKDQNLDKTFIGESFTLENSIFLENLLPGTVYYLEIIAIDRGGNRSSVKNLSFTTLFEPDRVAPANIRSFKAIASDSKIDLSWLNPPDADFNRIKIKRSDIFYPINPEDGIFVYEGSGNDAVDLGLENGKDYYYTAFAYDFSGNFSSGAVLRAKPNNILLPAISLTPAPSAISTASPLPSLSPSVSPEIKRMDLEDFIFFQNDKKLAVINQEIKAEADKSISVSAEFNKLDPEISVLMLILEKNDGSGEVSSFLFKKNPENKDYSVTLYPPENTDFKMTVAFLDSKNNPVRAVSGKLVILPASRTPGTISWYFNLLLFIFVLFLVAILRYVLKKMQKTDKFVLVKNEKTFQDKEKKR